MNEQAVQPPDINEVVARMEPLTAHLYPALERAAQRAHAFFVNEAEEEGAEAVTINRHLFPSLFRHYAKKALGKDGMVVAEEGNLAWERAEASNDGLIIHFDGLEIRVLKQPTAEGLDLPMPQSWSRLHFYQQQFTLGPPHSNRCNVVVLWDVTAGYVLNGLHVVIPKFATWSEVQIYGQAPLPHPATTLRPSLVPDFDHDDDVAIIPAADEETGDER